MHAALHLPPSTDDEALTTRAEAEGLVALALSRRTIRREVRGLVIHYDTAVPADVRRGARRLADLIEGEPKIVGLPVNVPPRAIARLPPGCCHRQLWPWSGPPSVGRAFKRR